MPLPIQPNNTSNNMHNSGNSNMGVDYSFLSNMFSKKTASTGLFSVDDMSAAKLFSIWLNGDKKEQYVFKAAGSNLNQQDLRDLQRRGLIKLNGSDIELTQSGKKVIKIISLGENNSFLKTQKKKKYTEILASMNKKGKGGYRIAFHTDIDLTKF